MVDKMIRLLTFLCVLSLAACGVPRDPEGTLDRARGGEMRVGVASSDPWTAWSGGEPSGVEVELVEDFAAEIDSEIVWVEGSEAEVMEALEAGELDLVIGGLTSTSPWSSMAALTHPYITTKVLIAVPSGSEIPDDLADVDVAVERGTSAAGILEKTDANPLIVEDIAEAEGPAAVENWLLDDLDLVETDVTLEETDHVMAVRMGENDWMTELETYLLERQDVVERLLDEVEP